MSIHGGRSFGRGVVAVCAAGALLVSLLASPASAEFAPNDTNIKGLLKGGQIVLQQDEGEDMVFPLGDKNGSSVKEKTEDSVCDTKDPKEPRSYFTAHVAGDGKVSDFAFHFAQASTGEKFNIFFQQYEVCAQLGVKGPIQGSIDGKQMELNPGPLVTANFIIKTKPQGNVQWVCSTQTDPGNHSGKFSEPKLEDTKDPENPHQWNLDHAPKNQKFLVPEVQSTSECPSSVAGQVNTRLGLPTAGEAEFKWHVYDCNVKDCNDIEGHPNKS